MLSHQVQDLAFLCGFGVLRHGQVVEGDVVRRCETLEFTMVRHNGWDLNVQLPRALSEEQVIQRVANFGHHDEDSGFVSARNNVVLHLQVGSQVAKRRSQMLRGVGMAEMDPHEELLAVDIRVLLQVENVQIVLGQHACHRVDDAWFIRTGQCQDMVLGHGLRCH